MEIFVYKYTDYLNESSNLYKSIALAISLPITNLKKKCSPPTILHYSQSVKLMYFALIKDLFFLSLLYLSVSIL